MKLYHYITKSRKPNLNFWEHLYAGKIKEYVGNDIWNAYKKISIIRNPWDHALSQYLWVKKYNFKGGEHDFEKYLQTSYVNLFPFYFIAGEFVINEMIKFESLKNNTYSLLARLNINKSLELPETKNKVRDKKKYQNFYTQTTSNILLKKNRIIINQFNYNFDE